MREIRAQGIYEHKSKIDYYLSYCQDSEPATYTFAVCDIQQSVTAQNIIVFSDYLFRIALKAYECRQY